MCENYFLRNIFGNVAKTLYLWGHNKERGNIAIKLKE